MASIPSLNETKFQLGTLQRIETKDGEKPRYRQPLTYDDNKLIISLTPYRLSSLNLTENHFNFKSLKVPVDKYLRQQLIMLEKYMITNAKIPDDVKSTWKPSNKMKSPYKHFWRGPAWYVPISDWCKVQINQKLYNLNDCLSDLREGIYQIFIDIPYIYYGPHALDYVCSITARITKVVYEPLPSHSDIDELLNSLTPTEKPSSLKRKHKSKGRQKTQQEVKG